MSVEIKLHKFDIPDGLNFGKKVAVDGEFMGLTVARDPLCLIQLSSGNSDAHIIQLDRTSYKAPNLIKILSDENIKKLFHFARADLAHIKYYLKTDVKNFDCSKIKLINSGVSIMGFVSGIIHILEYPPESAEFDPDNNVS